MMASLDPLDVDIGLTSSGMFGTTIAIDGGGDDEVRCSRCGFHGADIRVMPCGCAFHAVSHLRRTFLEYGRTWETFVVGWRSGKGTRMAPRMVDMAPVLFTFGLL